MKLERKNRASLTGGCSLSHLPGRSGKVFLSDSWKHLVAKPQWLWTLSGYCLERQYGKNPQCITILGYLEATPFHKVGFTRESF